MHDLFQKHRILIELTPARTDDIHNENPARLEEILNENPTRLEETVFLEKIVHG